MKVIRLVLLIILIIVIIVGCSLRNQMSSKETLGNIKDLIIYLPDEGATWVYKGTGVYYHEMTLEDISSSDQSFYYTIKGEILSDKKNSSYDDYLTEIRYIISRKGWQQELKQSKLLDSKYKGMFLIKFPIEVGNTWQENVLDFNDNQRIINAEIEEIEFVDDEKVITVRYNEKNSEYYEIRKIMQGKGIVSFKQNMEFNQENHILAYSLEEFYLKGAPIKSSMKSFLVSYNNAWENYYNNNESGILDYIKKDSSLASTISEFQINETIEILFLDLSIKSINVNENKYEILVNESFQIRENGKNYIQNNEIKYTLIKGEEGFQIVEIKQMP